MLGMFAKTEKFNQPLNNWDVSNVKNMLGMFYNAEKFNQPLDKWNVSNVTNMRLMFYYAKSFNQPLNKWDVSNVTNMNQLFEGSKLSTDNYDSTLIGWSKQNVQSGVELGAKGINYCKSWFERFKLWFYYNWSFNDAGITNYGCYFSNIFTAFTASKHDQNKTLSIDNPKKQLDISIYPNPTSGMVYIEGNFTRLKVYDLLGKRLINKFITNPKHVIDLRHLENGVYILQLSDGVKLSTKKIIKN
jgi:surface protein